MARPWIGSANFIFYFYFTQFGLKQFFTGVSKNTSLFKIINTKDITKDNSFEKKQLSQ